MALGLLAHGLLCAVPSDPAAVAVAAGVSPPWRCVCTPVVLSPAVGIKDLPFFFPLLSFSLLVALRGRGGAAGGRRVRGGFLALPQAGPWRRRRRWRRPCPAAAAAEPAGVRAVGAASPCCGCSGGLLGTREGWEGAAACAGGGVPLPFGACLRRVPSGAGVAPPFSRAAGPGEGVPGWGDALSPSRAGAESPPRFQRWPCGAGGCTPCTRARSCPRRTRCCGRRSGTSPRRS